MGAPQAASMQLERPRYGAQEVASPAPACAPSMEDFLVFHCNFVSKGTLCGRVLDEGWITACCHIFCKEHTKEWFDAHVDCPICREGPIKFVRIDVSRTAARHRARTALLGMAPPDLLQAFKVAMQFWVDQKVLEHQQARSGMHELSKRQILLEDRIRAKLQELEASSSDVKEEQHRLERAIEDIGQANTKADLQVERARRDLAAEQDKLGRLQRQLAGNSRRELFPAGSGRQQGADLGWEEGASAARLGPRIDVSGAALSRTMRFGDMPNFRNADVMEPARASSLRLGEAQGYERPLALLSGGAPPAWKAPVYTPAFAGTGRMTKRRIT